MAYKTRPTATVIKNFVDVFNKDNFYDSENYLAAIKLTKAFPENDDYKNVFIKVNFINGAFKTTIGDTFGVAKQVFEKVKNIDSRLQQGDTTQYVTLCLVIVRSHETRLWHPRRKSGYDA